MCGICGYVDTGSGGTSKEVLRAMCAAMIHRGPDDEGVLAGQGFGLGMRRLAIIDVEGGRQPVHNEDETVWLILNGEIYNYRQLRDELHVRGHCFSTRSDTEVLVHAYEEWGERCVDRLNGMFAFAVWDTRSRSMMLARDRVGIKPLYYLAEHERLIFASELRSLLASGHVQPTLDLTSLDLYLALEYVPSPHTIVRGVRKLGPGQTLTWRQPDGRFSVHRYWDVDLAEGEETASKGVAEQAAELRAVLKEAVRKELVSDVPIGVFLSGGIDSSAVAAMMAELIPGRVNSFSIAFNDPSFDESTHAREVARWLGTNHRELTLEPSLLPDVLPTVMDRLDEPLADASILPTYLLSRFARQHVKVALGGDGGDELFAGYPTLLAHRLAGLYQRVPGGLRQHLIAPSIEKLPVSLDNFSLDFKAKRFVRDACLPVSDRHLRWMGAFTAEERLRLLTRDVREELNASGGTAETVVLQQVATQRLRHPINQVLYLDMKLYLEGDILVKLDRASMMASLEARVPLLNGDLVEHVARLPHRLKLSGLKTKYLLKRSLRGVLPDHILARPKKGFGIPVAKWIRGPLREPLLDVLSSERVEQDRLFDYSTVHTLLDEHFSSRRDNRKQLWTLFVFQQWWALIQNCYPREEPRPSLVGRPRFAGALSEETHADG